MSRKSDVERRWRMGAVRRAWKLSWIMSGCGMREPQKMQSWARKCVVASRRYRGGSCSHVQSCVARLHLWLLPRTYG